MLIPFNTARDRRGNTQPGLWERYEIKPIGVLHIGANKGEEAPVYIELGVKRQIWIEANPEMYFELRIQISDNPQAVAINCAAGDIDFERAVLHVANNAGQSSSLLQLGTHKTQHPDVHYIKDIPVLMRRVDCIIPERVIENYDFLNVDVQGFEMQVLNGMGDYLKYFKWLYLEINANKVYEDCALVGEIDEYVKKFGFYRVETKWCGSWGDALFIKQQ